MKLRAQVSIAAPRERVFSLLTDPRAASRWQPDVKDCRLLTSGDLQTGSRIGVTVKEYGRKMELEMRVVKLVPNESNAYEMTGPGFSMQGEFRLASDGNTTLVEQVVELNPEGLGRFLMPLFRGRLERKLESRLDLLRQLAEGNYQIA
jgi:uncharacterized protein YndB with AHSA1/START domain